MLWVWTNWERLSRKTILWNALVRNFRILLLYILLIDWIHLCHNPRLEITFIWIQYIIIYSTKSRHNYKWVFHYLFHNSHYKYISTITFRNFKLVLRCKYCYYQKNRSYIKFGCDPMAFKFEFNWRKGFSKQSRSWRKFCKQKHGQRIGSINFSQSICLPHMDDNLTTSFKKMLQINKHLISWLWSPKR